MLSFSRLKSSARVALSCVHAGGREPQGPWGPPLPALWDWSVCREPNSLWLWTWGIGLPAHAPIPGCSCFLGGLLLCRISLIVGWYSCIHLTPHPLTLLSVPSIPSGALRQATGSIKFLSAHGHSQLRPSGPDSGNSAPQSHPSQSTGHAPGPYSLGCGKKEGTQRQGLGRAKEVCEVSLPASPQPQPLCMGTGPGWAEMPLVYFPWTVLHLPAPFSFRVPYSTLLLCSWSS